MQLIVLYVDFKLDESYTPSKVSIRAGDGFHNLKVILLVWVWLGGLIWLLWLMMNDEFGKIYRRLRPWNSWSQLGGSIYPCLELILGKCFLVLVCGCVFLMGDMKAYCREFKGTSKNRFLQKVKLAYISSNV